MIINLIANFHQILILITTFKTIYNKGHVFVLQVSLWEYHLEIPVFCSQTSLLAKDKALEISVQYPESKLSSQTYKRYSFDSPLFLEMF